MATLDLRQIFFLPPGAFRSVRTGLMLRMYPSAKKMLQFIKSGVDEVDMSITANTISLSQQHHQWITLDRLSETTQGSHG
jgi:hypothetical protein